MKKTFLTFILTLTTMLMCIFGFFACGGDDSSGDFSTIIGGDTNCEHLWSDWTEEQGATCKSTGLKGRICSLCNGKEKKIIGKTTHKYISKNACEYCGLELTYTSGLDYEKLGNFYVVKGIGEAKESDIIIPAKHAGYSVKYINAGAFRDCISLTSITIPDSITFIPSDVFQGCTNLTKVSIPDSLTDMASDAFDDCESLIYNIKDDLKYLGNDNNKYLYLVGVVGDSSVVNDSITSITIDDNCKIIGDYAFEFCDSLTSVVIPDSVTTIGDCAFCGCHSLKNITIPNSVTYIDYHAFSLCESLIYNIKDGLKYLGNDNNKYLFLAGVVGNNDSITSVTIDDNCRIIGADSFRDCISITNVKIPNNVTFIGFYAFFGCRSLTNITIPNSVTRIDAGAFMDCSSLTEIVIPDSVTFINSWAFSGCSNLNSVVISDSVTTIGKEAFSDCDSLTIFCVATTKPDGWNDEWNSNCPVVWGYKA